MTDAIDFARKFLESLHRFDLSTLLSVCSIAIWRVEDEWTSDGKWYGDDDLPPDAAVVVAPAPVDAALKALPPADRKRVAEAISAGYQSNSTFDDIRVETIRNATVEGGVAMLAELIIHRDMMIAVATGGGVRIQDVNDYYIAREARLREALPVDAKYENPHDDLWAWYHYWSEHFGRWAERRHYINQLFGPAVTAMAKRSTLPSPQRDATGWERVDRTLSKARSQFELASAEEDYQAIGLLCREVIISLAQAVFDPGIHKTIDGVEASKTDANRMLEAYIAHVFPGESYKEVRAHHRASLALALNLQHRRTATRQLAALCVEASASTVAVVSIIARPD
ncbi:hypothetical protein [Sphingomonas mali]|uniref:hypothetical protein n=1 Tax=Sphingomonas mali TaxID=40682 RepID=UPI00082BAF14|nr:hypothetical protein [Sphingomonas mali]